MKINLLAIGTKMPKWVVDGFKEYKSRLPADFNIQLFELPAQKRTKNANLVKIMEQESLLLFDNIPQDNRIIALDRQGKSLTTTTLCAELTALRSQNQDISLLIGGPEGISKDCLQKANAIWSLSELTLPHPLVRLLVAEQIYRVWSMMNNHPYHRGQSFRYTL